MKCPPRRWWNRPQWWSLGLLMASSCPATLQRNLDILLAPDALENALRLPTSAVAGIFSQLFRLLNGS